MSSDSSFDMIEGGGRTIREKRHKKEAAEAIREAEDTQSLPHAARQLIDLGASKADVAKLFNVKKVPLVVDPFEVAQGCHIGTEPTQIAMATPAMLEKQAGMGPITVIRDKKDSKLKFCINHDVINEETAQRQAFILNAGAMQDRMNRALQEMIKRSVLKDAAPGEADRALKMSDEAFVKKLAEKVRDASDEVNKAKRKEMVMQMARDLSALNDDELRTMISVPDLSRPAEKKTALEKAARALLFAADVCKMAETSQNPEIACLQEEVRDGGKTLLQGSGIKKYEKESDEMCAFVADRCVPAPLAEPTIDDKVVKTSARWVDNLREFSDKIKREKQAAIASRLDSKR